MNDFSSTTIQTVPAAAELRNVKGFYPLRYLRKTVSEKTGAEVWKLDLRYQKLWFRMACPNGRMLLTPLRVTEQLAVFEASVFQGREDQMPLSRCTASVTRDDCKDGRYMEAAQDKALSEALENAGFGIQLCDFVEMTRHSLYGSELETAMVANAVAAAQQENPAAASNRQPKQYTKNSVQVTSPVRNVQMPEKAPVENPTVRQAAPAPVPKTEKNTVSQNVSSQADDKQPALLDMIARPTAEEDTAKADSETPASDSEASTPADKVNDELPAEEKTPGLNAPGTESQVDSAENAVSKPASEIVPPPARNPVQAAPAAASSLDQLLAATHQRVLEFPSKNTAVKTPAVSQPASDPMPVNEAQLAGGTYTPDMTVDEIMSRMTLEEANQVVVQKGFCAGWTLEQVAKSRSASLRFYVCSDSSSNLLKAAAKIVLNNLTLAKAG